jgi:hypothetical protein
MQSPLPLRIFLTVLLLFAIVVIECAVGGTRLVFSIPSYSVLGLAAVASIFRRSVVPGKPSVVCLVTSAVFFGYVLWRAIYSPVEYFAWGDLYMVLGCLAVLPTSLPAGTRGVRLSSDNFHPCCLRFSSGCGFCRRQLMPFVSSAENPVAAPAVLISSIRRTLEATSFVLAFAFWHLKTWKRIPAGYIAVCYVELQSRAAGALPELVVLADRICRDQPSCTPKTRGTFAEPLSRRSSELSARCIAVLLMSISLRQRPA